QLAHRLMISGLPRNSDSFLEGPLRPCNVASLTVPPISISPGDFATDCGNRATAPSKSIATNALFTGNRPRGLSFISFGIRAHDGAGDYLRTQSIRSPSPERQPPRSPPIPV